MELNLIQQAAERREQLKNNIANSFNPLNEQSIEQLIKSEEDQFDWLEKGKRIRAVIGEKRTHGGREYIRTMDGWKYHGKGTGVKATAHRESSLSHHVEAGKGEKIGESEVITLDKDHKDKKNGYLDHKDEDVAKHHGFDLQEYQALHPQTKDQLAADMVADKKFNTPSKKKQSELDKDKKETSIDTKLAELKGKKPSQIEHIYESIREKIATDDYGYDPSDDEWDDGDDEDSINRDTDKEFKSRYGVDYSDAMEIAEKAATTKSTKTMTFKEILADPEGKKLIEAIEHGSSDPAIINDLKDQLKSKFGYQYDETVSSKDTAKKDKFFEDQKGTASSKHIGDMTFTEKKAAAKQLGIDPTGKTVGQLNKELADKNVDKALQEWKDKRKSASTETEEYVPQKRISTDPPKKSGGRQSSIAGLGAINLNTGSSKHFNIYDTWGEDTTYEIYEMHKFGVVDSDTKKEYRIVATSGKKPINDIGDIQDFQADQSRKPLFRGKMIDHATGSDLKKLAKVYGSSIRGFTYK